MLTSIGCVGTYSAFLGIPFSFVSDSKRDKKLAAVFILPGMCAIVKLNCRTYSHASHNGGGMILIWQNRVTDLLSVIIFTGVGVPQHLCPNSLNAKYFARNSSA